MKPSRSILLLGLLAFAVPLLAAPSAGKSTAAVSDLASLANETPVQIMAFFSSTDYKKLNRSNAEFIKNVYRAALHREPDAKGFSDWMAALQKNVHDSRVRENIISAILKSPEYSNLHSGSSPVALHPEDASRNPGNVLFNKTGVFVNFAGVFPAGQFAPMLKKGGVTWIALQIDNGGGVRSDNVAAIESGWMEAWRTAGFKVGFWGCPRGVNQHESQAAVDEATPLVQADAALAVKLAAQYHADLYIANCEAYFQSFSQKDPTPALNRIYVEAFKRAADASGIGNIPKALSSMGRVALDMQPWIDHGWDALPQAYWNSYSVYQPSLCVDYYVKVAGWPIERVHPTIATYPGEGENRSVSLKDYAADIKTRATTGFSYYLQESYLGLNNSAYEQLAEIAVR